MGRIFIGNLSETKINWIYKYELMDKSIEEQYITSMYYTMSTILTMGFGDIVA